MHREMGWGPGGSLLHTPARRRGFPGPRTFPLPRLMHPAYFETRFRTERPVRSWPDAFVILTACATTGSSWSEETNAAADQRLAGALRARGLDPLRVVGYSPTTGHAEPGWACALDFDEACDLGVAFRQDALYVVRGDTLSVSYCDARRGQVPVGSFRARVDSEVDSDVEADLGSAGGDGATG